MANKALSFDGIDDKVTVSDSASLSSISPLSVEAWIKHTSPMASAEGIVTKDKPSNREFLLLVSPTGDALQFYLFSADAANYLQARGTTDIADGQWHYVVATWDGVNATGHIKLYVDGSEETLDSDTKTSTGYVPHDGTAPVELGRYGESNANCWDGIIDEVRISDKVRSQAEIEAIWERGTGRKMKVDGNTLALWHIDEDDGVIFDETGNNNDGTIDGASWVNGFRFPLTALRIRLGGTTYAIRLSEI